MTTEIKIIKGDITEVSVDAIVNAANKWLLGGGGVDGAIHNVAGPELYEECKALNGCESGKAKITRAYKLPAKYVIHTVGPIFGAEDGKEAEILESCYTSSLSLAKEHGAKTIAFPGISIGAFGYPMDKATEIAVATVKNYIEMFPDAFEEITFVAFNDDVRVGILRLTLRTLLFNKSDLFG
jgi:O-acetyl-ADP-ribose deacetylase (regulator of RNase III)